jgi:hypothetical protein
MTTICIWTLPFSLKKVLAIHQLYYKKNHIQRHQPNQHFSMINNEAINYSRKKKKKKNHLASFFNLEVGKGGGGGDQKRTPKVRCMPVQLQVWYKYAINHSHQLDFHSMVIRFMHLSLPTKPVEVDDLSA